MQAGKNIYFASDFHLGVPTFEKSLERERKVVAWLSSIQNDAEEIFLVGDLFDFWFEHKHTAPKGYLRFLGKLAELSDKGTRIHVFTGNHDMWMFDYLSKEINCVIYRAPIERDFNGKKFFIGHGDGLGPGDKGYKFIKKIFANKFCQWCFARLHPNFSFGLANYFSKRSRIMTGTSDGIYLGDDKEFLVQFCKEYTLKNKIDYFIFGHRHLPLDMKINNDCRYINLGEWINYQTYAVFDGTELKLNKF